MVNNLFPNLTHAVALIGVQNGTFARDLAPDQLHASQTFNVGPAATEALLSGAIDVAFIGPSPSIKAFTKSNGAVRIIAGSALGGAGLVTKASITSVSSGCCSMLWCSAASSAWCCAAGAWPRGYSGSFRG